MCGRVGAKACHLIRWTLGAIPGDQHFDTMAGTKAGDHG